MRESRNEPVDRGRAHEAKDCPVAGKVNLRSQSPQEPFRVDLWARLRLATRKPTAMPVSMEVLRHGTRRNVSRLISGIVHWPLEGLESSLSSLDIAAFATVKRVMWSARRAEGQLIYRFL
eukprot:scaffold3726_cov270-Pinguiococcus_pyrenoidosus.AAC.10